MREDKLEVVYRDRPKIEGTLAYLLEVLDARATVFIILKDAPYGLRRRVCDFESDEKFMQEFGGNPIDSLTVGTVNKIIITPVGRR